MYETDFPEYGRHATKKKYYGQCLVIEFSSGATIEVYPDEITFD